MFTYDENKMRERESVGTFLVFVVMVRVMKLSFLLLEWHSHDIIGNIAELGLYLLVHV